MIAGVYPAQTYPAGFPLLAGSAYTDAGTFSLTVGLSGVDSAGSTDTGAIPISIILSGASLFGAVDAGVIPVTVALSGATTTGYADTGTIHVTWTIGGTELYSPTTTILKSGLSAHPHVGSKALIGAGLSGVVSL